MKIRKNKNEKEEKKNVGRGHESFIGFLVLSFNHEKKKVTMQM